MRLTALERMRPIPRTPRLSLLLPAAALLLAACGGGSSVALQPATASTSPGDGALRAVYPSHMRHEVSGDRTFTYEADSTVDVYEINGGRYPEISWILTASTGTFTDTLDDGSLLIWSADLAPGEYHGPGSYVIDGLNAPVGAPASSIRSAAYMRLTTNQPGPETVLEYNVLHEPCTFEYEAAAARGEVHCPKLGLDRDPTRTISWTWTWERLPASSPAPSVN